MRKNRFITGYAGLRALAVIGVILYHLDPNTFIGGYLGVPIFLVLSGYLVTDHMLRAYSLRGSYDSRHFYLRRAHKLYPQLVTLLWVTSAWIMLFQRNLLPKLGQIVLTNLLNLYNFWQIINGQSYFARFAANASPFTHLWTMSIEGQFYLLWPLVIWLLVRFAHSRKKIFWCLFVLSLFSALEMLLLYNGGANLNRIYYGTDTRFFALGFGAALAVVWPIEDLRAHIEPTDSRILDITGLVAFLGMFCLACSNQMNPQTSFPYRGGMLLFTILTCLFAAVIAHPGSHWNGWLTNPVFNWIGSRSYGIYLYQFPVMIFFEDKVTNLAAHPFLYPLFEVVIILALSELTYRVIERPMLHFKWQSWSQLVEEFYRQKLIKKITLSGLSLALLVGTVGMLISPFIRGKNFNHTRLALQIMANRRQQTRDNRALIAKMKRHRPKSIARSKAYHKAHKLALKHPINRLFVKYGISLTQLELAHTVQLTAVGDSVMAGSSNNLKKLMPKAVINAAVSRQLNVAFGLFNGYQKQGVLAKNVLVGLGTNGPFSMGDLDHLMQILGPKRHVFWINIYVPSRPWQNQVNNLLKQASHRYHNLTIINWYGHAKNHPDWFYGDHTHPNSKGSKYYSAFIAKTIVKHSKF